ncbi:TM2 domain-containing protein [Tenacibaculum sp. SDUM215027]|uniref:TM2 domain-containing protein n=1 Tax=Tenacibaculum sp. SDUM215027 TaxID=3422596 RepID=UPI003D311937
MNKHYLQSKVKSTGTAYILLLFLGAHYAYLGKWGVQFLYWFTLGGLGIWALIDLFTMSSKVEKYNSLIFQQIEEIDKKEREDECARNIAMVQAMKA